LESLYFVVF